MYCKRDVVWCVGVPDLPMGAAVTPTAVRGLQVHHSGIKAEARGFRGAFVAPAEGCGFTFSGLMVF